MRIEGVPVNLVVTQAVQKPHLSWNDCMSSNLLSSLMPVHLHYYCLADCLTKERADVLAAPCRCLPFMYESDYPSLLVVLFVVGNN